MRVQRAVVTGAGGFLGRHVTLQLLAAGTEVVGVDLARVPPSSLATDGVRWVQADLRHDGRWRDALAGADLVIHTAARVSDWGERSWFIAANIDGTRRVVTAAARQGVPRFVHVSSVVVYGRGDAAYGALLTEDVPPAPTGAPYTDSKIASERIARRVADRTGVALTVVRPGDVYGVGSIPWVERPLDLLARRRFVVVDGGRWPLSPVHVDDVVDGIVAAAIKPTAGRTYNLAGLPVAARRYFAHHARHLGVRLPSVPSAAARAAGAVFERAGRLAGRDPLFSPHGVEYVSHRCGYATDRAHAELGWRPRHDVEVSLPAVLAAYPRRPVGGAGRILTGPGRRGR